MSKTFIVLGLVAYLFLSSFVISYTYEESGDYWRPGFIEEVPVIQTNFTEGTNITDYYPSLKVTLGSWVIEGSELVSKGLINEFMMTPRMSDPHWIMYNVSNMNDNLVRIYVFKNYGLLSTDTAYFELDLENNRINAVKDQENWRDIWEDREVLKSVPYTFSSSHIIETNTSLEDVWTVIGTPDIPAELYIDDELVMYVLFENLGSGALNVDFSGFYNEQIDMRISFISALESPQSVIVEDWMDYLKLMTIILTYFPPSVVMPWWLNFLGIKLPLMGLCWVGGEMIRGN